MAVKSYEYEGFRVEFDLDRCVHAAECLRGLPQVFDTERRPWIDPSQAPASAIAEVIRRCPSGALQYAFSGEEPDPDVTIEIVPSGPLYVRGDIRLHVPGGEQVSETRVALCRCGASQNKPFCDNSHRASGFEDPGEVADSKLRPADGEEGGGVDISFSANGPISVKGASIEIVDSAEQRVSGGRGSLCRCGGSGNKPFCDGSHHRVGFEADG